jgi:hypothetical protein
MSVVFHEAEPARRLVEPIEAHYQSLYLTAPTHVSIMSLDVFKGVEAVYLAKSSWICSSVV